MNIRAIVDNIRNTSKGKPRLSFNCKDRGQDLEGLAPIVLQDARLRNINKGDRREMAAHFLLRVSRGDTSLLRSTKTLNRMLNGLCLCGPEQPFGLAVHWFRSFDMVSPQQAAAAVNDLNRVWEDGDQRAEHFTGDLLRAVDRHNELFRKNQRLDPLPAPAMEYSVLYIDTDLSSGERTPDWAELDEEDAAPIALAEKAMLEAHRRLQKQMEDAKKAAAESLQNMVDAINAAPDRVEVSAQSSWTLAELRSAGLNKKELAQVSLFRKESVTVPQAAEVLECAPRLV